MKKQDTISHLQTHDFHRIKIFPYIRAPSWRLKDDQERGWVGGLACFVGTWKDLLRRECSQLGLSFWLTSEWYNEDISVEESIGFLRGCIRV